MEIVSDKLKISSLFMISELKKKWHRNRFSLILPHVEGKYGVGLIEIYSKGFFSEDNPCVLLLFLWGDDH